MFKMHYVHARPTVHSNISEKRMSIWRKLAGLHQAEVRLKHGKQCFGIGGWWILHRHFSLELQVARKG